MLIEKRMHEGAAFSPERKMKKRDFDLYITFFFKFFDLVHSMSSFLNHLNIKDTSEK